MRSFTKGEYFMDVPVETSDVPVFSESFLYSAVGKDEARFILGVAEEYDALIRLLGEKAIKELLEQWKRKGR